MKKFSSIIIAGAVLLTSATANAITGSYNCSGNDLIADQSFKGKLEIASSGDNNNVYVLKWHYSDSENYTGYGMLNGDVLSAVFHLEGKEDSKHPVYGVQMYKIANGSLDGKWVYYGIEAVGGEEKCTK